MILARISWQGRLEVAMWGNTTISRELSFSSKKSTISKYLSACIASMEINNWIKTTGEVVS